MNDLPTITQVDQGDPRSKAWLDAEQRLFAHYGLEYKVHFVEMNEPNLRVRVLEVGAGRPLLMVPGGGGAAFYFAGLMAELNGWRMIALNRPGGGLSDGIDHRQVDVRHLAVNTLRSVADAFQLDRVPIVCNSMGGLWSFWFALESPERVSKMVQMGCPALILNTSAPFFMRLLGVPGMNRLFAPMMQPKRIEATRDSGRFMGSSQEDIDRVPRAFWEAGYYDVYLPGPNMFINLLSAVLTLTGANRRYQLGAEQLRRVQQPVLFLWGENDPFGNLDVAHQAVRLIPNAKLHEMRTGHLPFVDQPEECGRVIREFLSKEAQ